jgi:uncharacterized protein
MSQILKGWSMVRMKRYALMAAALLGCRATIELKAQQTYAVTMRDGIHLSTDVYGVVSGVRKPVLLTRTPYDKRAVKATAERFAGAGYAAVVQDTRGAYASEGRYVHYNNDDQDGYDTIEWIVRQPWCNGRVGMWGASHPGEVQWLAAVGRPPGLLAIAPIAASSSLYHIMYQGGALRLALLAAGAALRVNPPPEGVNPPKDFRGVHQHLPVSTLDEAIGWPMPWMEGIIRHNRPDGFWARLEALQQLPELAVASQTIVGYYDITCGEAVENFLRLPLNGRKQMILGPWDHSTIGQRSVAGVDFGPAAVIDAETENLSWFDRFLKLGETPKEFSAVRYFVMGDDVWRTAATWPPEGSSLISLYFHSGGHAQTRNGDGVLAWAAPHNGEAPDSFRSDPDDPVPAEPGNAPSPSRATPWRPLDRRSIEDRRDVLVYTSTVRTAPLTIAGRLTADLWVSADAVDADWAVKVVDVAPGGAARGLAEGILRSSGRDPIEYPALLTPGRRYRVTVDLGHTAATILPGHAIRAEIAGSAFPMFDRNLHTGAGPTGEHKVIASQSIWHTPVAASRLILPVSGAASGLQ